MRLGSLIAMLLLVGGMWFFSACGDTGDDTVFREVAYTPTPAPTRGPNPCGNGTVDQGEQCDDAVAGSCTGANAGKSCVCCVCFGSDTQPLGDRTFSIKRHANSSVINSTFISSGLACNDVSIAWREGNLLLRAGRPDKDLPGEEACSATLELVEDAIFGFASPVGTTACVKLFAAGSSGTIDCDGGTPHDVEFFQNSHGPAENDRPDLQVGLGDPTLPGRAPVTLRIANGVLVNLPVGSTLDDCQTLDYDDPVNDPKWQGKLRETDAIFGPIDFTTETATSIIEEPLQGNGTAGPTAMCSTHGEAFSCATWSREDAEGALAGPLAGLDTIVGDVLIGDTSNIIVITDNDN